MLAAARQRSPLVEPPTPSYVPNAGALMRLWQAESWEQTRAIRYLGCMIGPPIVVVPLRETLRAVIDEEPPQGSALHYRHLHQPNPAGKQQPQDQTVTLPLWLIRLTLVSR